MSGQCLETIYLLLVMYCTPLCMPSLKVFFIVRVPCSGFGCCCFALYLYNNIVLDDDMMHQLSLSPSVCSDRLIGKGIQVLYGFSTTLY